MARFINIRLLQGAVAIACLWAGAIWWIERPRLMQGTWVNLFEGSSFFEGKSLHDACRSGSNFFYQASWFAYYPDPKSKIWRELDTANRTRPGIFVSSDGVWPVTAYKVKFVGRKRVSRLLGLASILGAGYGHLSAFGSEVTPETLISIEEVPAVMCDISSPQPRDYPPAAQRPSKPPPNPKHNAAATAPRRQ